MGSPWGAATQFLPNPAQRHPSPASCTDWLRASELGKVGRTACYAPGLPDSLHLLASFQHVFSPPPFLFGMAFLLLCPGRFSLWPSLPFLVRRRACKPFHPTVALGRERHEPLQSLLTFTKVSSFYLPCPESRATSSGRPRESAAVSGVLAGKDGGACKRNVRASRWQELTWSSKRLFALLLPWPSRGNPFGCFISATFHTVPSPPPQIDSMKL